jgi:hypothetical protein
MMKKERRKNEKPRMKINMVEKKSKKKRHPIHEIYPIQN